MYAAGKTPQTDGTNWYLTPEGDKFREQIRPILDEVYKEGERTIGLERVQILLSGLKEMHDVLENI